MSEICTLGKVNVPMKNDIVISLFLDQCLLDFLSGENMKV